MAIGFDENIVEKSLNKRIRLSVLFITLIFVFIILRLCYLQILKGTKYSALSSNNRIRITNLPAPRGIIFSKSGQALVKNIPSFDLNLIPQDTPDAEKTLASISRLLSLEPERLKKTLEKKKGRPPFEPVTLKKELSWKEMSLVLSKKMDLQGITIDVVPKRLYSFEGLAPHVFGFLGEIDKAEFQKQGSRNYDIGDLIGKYGLEKWGESFLRGKKGGLQTEVDVLGNRKNVLAEIDPVPGTDITISIIPELQKTAEALLSERTGAVVAMDPGSGEVLALVSAPGFDPNLFARGIDQKDWDLLIKNPKHPLLNRALQSQQPPGSVFKVVTAVAALEENIVDPKDRIFCPGFFKLGTRTFRCWKRGGHGWMDMKSAIVESCDTYFYNVSLKLGIDTIIKYADMMGFGRKTEIALEGEKAGLLPSPEWKLKKYGVGWQRGETLNVSIGQGFLLATPLQVATVYCGLATGGKIPRPRIILSVDSKAAQKSYSPETVKEYPLSARTLAYIKDALAGVVNSPKGTGARARIKGYLVAGKTGTAQVTSKKNLSEKNEKIPWHLKHHAWFAAFAPVEDPRIVVCVLLEHGESGGRFAAPVAKEILKTFFSLEKRCLTDG